MAHLLMCADRDATPPGEEKDPSLGAAPIFLSFFFTITRGACTATEAAEMAAAADVLRAVTLDRLLECELNAQEALLVLQTLETALRAAPDTVQAPLVSSGATGGRASVTACLVGTY